MQACKKIDKACLLCLPHMLCAFCGIYCKLHASYNMHFGCGGVESSIKWHSLKLVHCRQSIAMDAMQISLLSSHSIHGQCLAKPGAYPAFQSIRRPVCSLQVPVHVVCLKYAFPVAYLQAASAKPRTGSLAMGPNICSR